MALGARTQLGRLAAAVGGLLIGLALTLSLARDSWIGAAVGIAVALALMPSAPRLRAIVPLLAAVAVGAGIALSSGGVALVSRFTSIQNPTGAGVSTAQGDRERVAAWDVALSVAEAHPSFGAGFGNLLAYLCNNVPDQGCSNSGNLGASSQAQSTYLQLLAEGGFAGGVAILLLLRGLVLDSASGLRRQRLLMAGVAGSLVAIGITWLTDYTIRYVAVAAMIAVVFGVVAAQSQRSESRDFLAEPEQTGPRAI